MTTLNEKKMLNDAVTGETKRCLAILTRMRDNLSDWMIENTSGEKIREDLNNTITQIIEGSPYIEFHQELLKRIPE